MLPTSMKVTKILLIVPGNSTLPLIKSDRINSLRKQYDLFLDEDKKRKERNEYILEKLDKMRYCTAVVPVRQKPTVFTETRTAAFPNVPRQAVESPASPPYDPRFLQLENPKKHVDETILQEISKKYILIPKLRPTCDDYITDTKPKIDDNTDWKSKYQILEQLKRDEKEQDSPPREEVFEAVRDQTNINYKEITTKDDSQPFVYKKDMPENQLSTNLLSYPKNTKNDEKRYYDNKVNEILETGNDGLHNYKNRTANTNLPETFVDNVNERFEKYERKVEEDVYDQIKPIDNTVIYDKSTNNYEYVENVDECINSPELDNIIKTGEKSPAEVLKADASQNKIENNYVPLEPDSNEQPKENDDNQQIHTNQETYLDREEVTFVQDVNATELINAINNITPITESNVVADTDYPVETIDVQEFTPHEDVQLEDGVNINPKPQVLVVQDDLTYHYDPIVQTENATEPTKTFDNEQASNEFYNEQVDQNYDYTEEAVVDNYNTEYTAPNENYEQNEYAYYEGAQTEQAYPETNDNEETTQRYDQNYEQQYGTAIDQEAYPQQGYDQGYAQGFEQPEYTEQMQHYEAPDQAQQNLENMQYEENQDNLTPEYVEQQLDNEQGYAEKQDENIEIRDVEKSEEKLQNLKLGDQQIH